MVSKEGLVELIQPKYEAAIGTRVNKEKIWEMFKATMDSIIDGCLADEDNAVVLAGIGKFEILRTAPRLTKVGVVDFVPRLRFRSSSKLDEALEIKMEQVPDPAKMAKVKEQLIKDGKMHQNLPVREKKEEAAAPAPAAAAAKTTTEAKPVSKPATEKQTPKKGPVKGKGSEGFEDEF